MTLLKPCIMCGELSTRSRCPDHRLDDHPNRSTHHAHANTARWKQLSKKARKLAPFCETCGTRDDLTTDHIIPIDEDPDLTYAIENLRVLCRTCNGRRGNNVTDTERQAVRQRIADNRSRRARHQRQLADQGGRASDLRFPPEGKAQRAMNTTTEVVT